MDTPELLKPAEARDIAKEIARQEILAAGLLTRAQAQDFIDAEIRRAVSGPVENVLSVMRSVDAHLRQVEQAYQENTRALSLIQGQFVGIQGIQTRHENQIESLVKRMTRIEQEKAVIEAKQVELRADIYGDATVKADNPSLFERMDELKTLLGEFRKDYDLRLQLVESYVKKQQAREQFVVNAAKRVWGLASAGLHDWRVLAGLLAAGAMIAAALLAGQQPRSDLFDWWR